MPAEGAPRRNASCSRTRWSPCSASSTVPSRWPSMEVYHKYGIPFMACDVWSDQITAKGYPEVFRNAPAVSLIDVTIGQWIAAAGFKNMAIIAEKNDVGLAARTLVAQELTKANVKFTAVDADPNLTDFTAQILRFKSTSPPFDFFLQHLLRGRRLSDDPPGARPWLRADARIAGSTIPAARRSIRPSGRMSARPASTWSPRMSACRRRRGTTRPRRSSRHTQKHNADPSGAVMESYDGAWLLFDAIKTAGRHRTQRRSSMRWRTPAMSARAASTRSPPATSRPGARRQGDPAGGSEHQGCARHRRLCLRDAYRYAVR